MKPLRLLFFGFVLGNAVLQDSSLGATLADFGYQSRTINGTLPIGTRPLLVIIADFAGAPALANNRDFYDNWVFNWSVPQSINGYFLENSNGRFLWTRAVSGTNSGTIGPVPFTQAERGEIRLDDPAGISRVVSKAAAWSGFRFDDFDVNGDGKVTGNELGILIINNDAESPGATRAIDPSTCLRPPGSSVQLCYDNGGNGGVSTAFHTIGLPTTAHELSHGAFRTLDLYYGPQASACLSGGLTLMSCTGANPVHLDPWHKMQLGWVEPRIRSLRSGGVEVLPIPQLLQADAPVILYDPQLGTSEFFMIEYRSQSVPGKIGYETGLGSQGLAIWYIKQDQTHNPVSIPNDIGNTVIIRGAPALDRGGTLSCCPTSANPVLWQSGETTPRLNWLYGPEMPNRILVRPFDADASTATFEWLREEDRWVDFSYSGFEFGTFDFPYDTFAEGVDYTPWGGTLKIKSGSSSEWRTVATRMTIQAYGGPVTIGR